MSISSAAHAQYASPLINIIQNLIRSARPRQSAKNGLVLVPLFFTVNIWWEGGDPSEVAIVIAKAIITFLAFSALSSAVYLFNDLRDVDQDRLHPTKRNRPIAAGTLDPGIAWGVLVLLIVLGLAAGFVISVPLGVLNCGYIALNVAYTLVLKHQVILDVMSISAGFVLRAVAGTLAINGTELTSGGLTTRIDLNISPWMYVVTALGALFIALVKRRSELEAAGEEAEGQRSILREYSTALLDQLVVIVAASTLMSYTLYTFSSGITVASNIPENNSMMLTIPFVAYGLFRYLYLMHMKGKGEAPEDALLSDRPLRLNIILWLGTATLILLLNA
ncbi:MAG: decaprenyl-phosphate phosphoribosyltransferase [Chloroflexi bacterium]|nr:decaprenyl-phosphate phosphoribosyltransferase [Chloroflexota bacterium]